MIMLDSNIVIHLLNKRSKQAHKIIANLNSVNDPDIGISSIVYEEILFGIFKRLNIIKLPEDHPLGQIPTISFTKLDAELTAKIEVDMEKKGQKKPRVDCFIAATAINQNARLYTLNTKDFEGIEELELL